jgi:hypothetical protein
MTRERLPNRRACETVDFYLDGTKYTGSVGYYPDGRVAEIFLDAFKSGTDLQIANCDEAVFTSLALQHGCPVETLKAAASKDRDGEPNRASMRLLDLLGEGR